MELISTYLRAAAASTSNSRRSTSSKKENTPIVYFSLSLSLPVFTIYLARPNNVFPETDSKIEKQKQRRDVQTEIFVF